MGYGYQSGYNAQRNGNFFGELPDSLLLGAWHRPGFSLGAPVYVGNSKKDGSGTDYVYTVEGVEGTQSPDSSYIVCYTKSGTRQWRTKLPTGFDSTSYSWLLGILYPSNDGLILCMRRNQSGTAESLVTLNATTGAMVWVSPVRCDQGFIRDQAVFNSDGDIVVFGRYEDSNPNTGVKKIDGLTGAVIWDKASYPGPHNLGWVTATFSPAEDFLYLFWDGALVTVDPTDGATLFTTSVLAGPTNTPTFITCDSKFVWLSLNRNFGLNTYLVCFIRNEDGSVTRVVTESRRGPGVWHFQRAIPAQYGINACTWHYWRTSPEEQDRLELIDDIGKSIFVTELPFGTGDGIWAEVLFDSNARLLYVNRGRQGSMHCMTYLPEEIASAWNKRQEDPSTAVESAGNILWTHNLGDARFCQPWLDVDGILYVNANGGLLAYGAEIATGHRPPQELGPPANGGYTAAGKEIVTATQFATIAEATGTWSDSNEAFTTDGAVALTSTDTDNETFSGFTDFDALPALADVKEVFVTVVAAYDDATGSGDLHLRAELSWDAGATWTTYVKTPNLPTFTDGLATFVLGGPQFTRDWTVAELDSTMFKVRITAGQTAVVDTPAWNLDSVSASVRYEI
jgi:hypothetical protein